MEIDDDFVDAQDDTRHKLEDPSTNLGTSKSTLQNNKEDNHSTTASETNSYKSKSVQKLDAKPQIIIQNKNGEHGNRNEIHKKNSKPSVNISKKDSAGNVSQDNRDPKVNSKKSDTYIEKTILNQMNDGGDAIQMCHGLPSSSKTIKKRLRSGVGSNINLTRITRVSLPRKSKNIAMKLLKELNNNKLLRNQHRKEGAKPHASKREHLAYVSLSETDDDSICPSCASDDGGGACSECGHSCCGNAMVE